MEKKMKVAILTNIIPTYREGFYDRIFNHNKLEVTVFCQDHLPGLNLQPIHEKYGERVRLVKFVSAKREKVSWQFLPWMEILRNYDVVFVSGNARVLSDVFLSILLRFLGKRLVIWTQAHSVGANQTTEKIRLMWTKLIKNIFVYTDAEVTYLRKRGFHSNFILGMNNGLDQKKIDSVVSSWNADKLAKWRTSKFFSNSVLVISCARLDPKNKFDEMILALPLILLKVPNLVWCIVGDGTVKHKLELMVKKAGLEDHVCFVGALYDEFELAPWFLASELLIHPASIGLTLMHAFGYGIPVITHNVVELHNPEYAAFEEGVTGHNFRYGDIRSLSDAVVSSLENLEDLRKMKKNVLKLARECYNVDIMVERFVQISTEAYLNNGKSQLRQLPNK